MANPREYVLIAGKQYACDTDTQQKVAASALSAAGVNSTHLYRAGMMTSLILLADTNVDPVANGTQPSPLSLRAQRNEAARKSLDKLESQLRHGMSIGAALGWAFQLGREFERDDQ